MINPIFVTAISTDSGKTLVSAILTEALQADYWKPLQSGTEGLDSDTVKNLISNQKSKIHPEKYLFKTPVSPHQAAEIDGIDVKLSDFKIPNTDNQLIIEGAGGILVPINHNGDLVIDLIQKLAPNVILVSNYYLGSINHTLMTIEILQSRKINIIGLIFNGIENTYSKNIILQKSGLKELLAIEQEKEINPQIVFKYAQKLKEKLNELGLA